MSSGMCADTLETLDELKLKHPTGRPVITPATSATSLTCQPDLVLYCLKQFPTEAAAKVAYHIDRMQLCGRSLCGPTDAMKQAQSKHKAKHTAKF